jgi:hypothetical protein
MGNHGKTWKNHGKSVKKMEELWKIIENRWKTNDIFPIFREPEICLSLLITSFDHWTCWDNYG